jgi:hypothetical protein
MLERVLFKLEEKDIPEERQEEPTAEQWLED